MAFGLKQQVEVRLQMAAYNMCQEVDKRVAVEGVTNKNIRSKVTATINQLLIGHNTMQGAKITIDISSCELDEFSRPDPE